MILYTDTSALVKKYVFEKGSDQVLEFFAGFTIIGTASITQAEMAAALSKAVRQGWVEEKVANTAWQDFQSHWQAYTRLPISLAIIDRSADLIWRYGLRAYDGIQLACALVWREAMGENTFFACFDQRLSLAARQEGLVSWPNRD